MRTHLQTNNGKRCAFKATVSHFGQKPAWKGAPLPTVCFVDVRYMDDSPATDHLWMTVGKQIASLNLQEGDTVVFNARIERYIKGYVNHREGIDERTIDYKLSYISKISKL